MDSSTRYAANEILSVVLAVLPPVKCAVDVGCGVGVWLSALKKQGIQEAIGIDGSWVDEEIQSLSNINIIHRNIEEPLKLEKRYDLAISLEVGEHLPEACANTYVNTLCNASDYILFSAAIPHQGGTNHVNEQWPLFWISKFEEREYLTLDIVRKRVHADKKIPWYYRQNILLFVKKGKETEIRTNNVALDSLPPEKYLLTYQKITNPGVKESLRNLCNALVSRVAEKSRNMLKLNGKCIRVGRRRK